MLSGPTLLCILQSQISVVFNMKYSELSTFSTSYCCCHDGANFFRPAAAAQSTCSHLVFRGAYHRRRGGETNGAPPSPPPRTGAPHPLASVNMAARPMGGRGGARLGQGECRHAPPSLRWQPPPPRMPATTTHPAHRARRPAAAAAVTGRAHRRRRRRDGPCRLGVDGRSSREREPWRSAP